MKHHHLHQAVLEHGRYTGVPHTYFYFLSRNEVAQERKELFRNINDDAFFLSNPGLRIWRWFFGKIPTGDQGTFKLMLFAEGNGCSLDLMRTWILLSKAWNDAKTAEKRSNRSFGCYLITIEICLSFSFHKARNTRCLCTSHVAFQ